MCSDPAFADPDFSAAKKVCLFVLDTNIVLDILVFNDPAAQPLKLALASKKIRWLATPAMRAELARVLAYPKITARLTFYQIDAEQVLAQFDAQARLVDVAARASVSCRDPDDQKFIDLAVAHKTTLLSKDRAVLCMKKRLLSLGVRAQRALNLVCPRPNGTQIGSSSNTNPDQSFSDKLTSMRATCASSERLATGHMRSGTSS